jgi:hypothetical protein
MTKERRIRDDLPPCPTCSNPPREIQHSSIGPCRCISWQILCTAEECEDQFATTTNMCLPAAEDEWALLVSMQEVKP